MTLVMIQYITKSKNIWKIKDFVEFSNHSFNGRPSAQDLISYLDDERIKISLILCHDGTMYGIYDVNPQFKEAYEMLLSEAKQKNK